MFRAEQEIGLYKLIKRLGRGGFGEVWLAERRAKFVTTKVAVKLPLDEQVDREAIKHEAVLWEQASGHPNVLPIIDADEYDGQIVIVSEYAPDGSLDDLLQKSGSLPARRAVELAIGILSGLDFLHSRKIIHRDIKPQNILLQGETPRLADFGISRVMRTTSVSMSLIGTPPFMAPEAFDRKRTAQTDIWSVGVILYQMLKGSLPFPHQNLTELLGAIVRDQPEPLPANISATLQQIVFKSLEKNPDERYSSARQMRDDLADFLISISQKNLAPTLRPDELDKTQPSPTLPPDNFLDRMQASPTAQNSASSTGETQPGIEKTQASPTTADAIFQPDTSKQPQGINASNEIFKLPTSEVSKEHSKTGYLKILAPLGVLLIAIAVGSYFWLRKSEVSQSKLPETTVMQTDGVAFENKLIPFLKGDKFGFVDANKKFIVEPRYEEAAPFSDGLALVKLKDKYGYVNEEGKEIIPLKYDDAISFSDEMAFVNLGAHKNEYGFVGGGKWGVIDKTGKEIVPFKYDQAFPFSEGLAAVSRDGWKWGFIDKTGNVLVPLKYDEVSEFSEGLAAVNKGKSGESSGKWGYIDKNGKEVIPVKYIQATSFSGELATVRAAKDSLGTLIDKTGNEIFTDKVKGIGKYSEGLVLSLIEDKCGYINKTGEIVIPFKYDYCDDFMDGLAGVAFKQIVNVGPADANANIPKGKDAQNMPQYRFKFGFIDKSGKEVIPFKYDEIRNQFRGQFMNKLKMVMLDGKWFYIAKDGTEYYEP